MFIKSNNSAKTGFFKFVLIVTRSDLFINIAVNCWEMLSDYSHSKRNCCKMKLGRFFPFLLLSSMHVPTTGYSVQAASALPLTTFKL